MKHNKPIAFFDLESTGLNVATDRIVSLSVIKIMPDGSTKTKTTLVNPEINIPQETIDIHGITNEMVKDAPTFKQLSKSLLAFFSGCDLGGYNAINFDIPLLSEEFGRCKMDFPDPDSRFVDCCTIFKKKEARDLESAYKFYCNKEMTNAHDAKADIEATYEIFLAQLEKYPDLKDVHGAIAFSQGDMRVDLAGKIIRDADGDYVYNFGKNRGQKVKKDPSLANWALGKDFTSNTKAVIRNILKELKY